jgi:hypothetical protein
MKRRIQHYLSYRKYPGLHWLLCACEGRGFRYHILGIGGR